MVLFKMKTKRLTVFLMYPFTSKCSNTNVVLGNWSKEFKPQVLSTLSPNSLGGNRSYPS